MSILTVNLKHLYQRRLMWLVYLLLGVLSFISLSGQIFVGYDDFSAWEIGQDTLVFSLMVLYLVGAVAGILLLDLLFKPMTFCLPRHHGISRLMVLTGGLLASVVGLVPLVVRLDALLLYGSVCFLANVTFFWLGVGTILLGPFVGGLIVLLPLAMLVCGGLGIHAVLGRFMVEHPGVLIFVTLTTSLSIGMKLWSKELERDVCGATGWRHLVGSTREKNRKTLIASSRDKKGDRQSRLGEAAQNWFLGRMTQSRSRRLITQIWGMLYETWGPVIAAWKRVVCVSVFFLLFLGYMERNTGLAFLIACTLASQMCAEDRACLITTSGRSERYLFAFLRFLCCTGVMVGVLGGWVALSLILARIAPTLSVGDKLLEFVPLDTHYLWLPLVVLPFMNCVQLALIGRPAKAFTAKMITMVPCALVLALCARWLPAEMRASCVVISIVIAWSVHWLALRYVYFRQSLC